MTGALVLVVLTAGCARNVVTTPGDVRAGALSPRDRAAVFERVWNEINDHYYDPNINGVDWPAAHVAYRAVIDTVTTDRSFYGAMQRMLGLLHDAHTRILPPASAALRDMQQTANVGLTVRAVAGRPTVVAVRPGSAAARAGIEPGMFIPLVNGDSTLTRVAAVARQLPAVGRPGSSEWRAYTQVFNGQLNAAMRLEVERADGSRFEATLVPDVVSNAPEADSRLLPSGNAYIRWTSFFPPADRLVREAVVRARSAPGMILDLRGNPGGSSQQLEAIAKLFLDARTPLYAWDQRHGSQARAPTPFYLGSVGGATYRGPIVILLNELSGSSAELFASGLQESGRARVVGVETCGCVLGISGFIKLTGGAEFSYSQRAYFTVHGEKLDGRGVIPDVRVASTLADIRAGRDAVLETADDLLLGKR